MSDGIKDRPTILRGFTIKFETGCGRIYITVNGTKEDGWFEVHHQRKIRLLQSDDA